MSKTDAKELVEKFKKIEEELIEILKVKSPEFANDEKKQLVKSEIKKYIKKVEKARALFEMYENVALQIEKLSVKKDNDVLDNISKLVSENGNQVELEYEDIQKIVGGTVTIVKKKKNKSASKEF